MKKHLIVRMAMILGLAGIIIFNPLVVLEALATPTTPPANLIGTQSVSETPKAVSTAEETKKYMLSAKYVNAVRNEFYRLLNKHRAANGLRELKVNSELQKYADIRADEQRTRFGHTRPDGSAAGSGWYNSKNTMNSRYAENALSTTSLSSNPAETAAYIFTRWKNSSGHNQHMLYKFSSQITMAFGIVPRLESNGKVTSGAIFATGY